MVKSGKTRTVSHDGYYTAWSGQDADAPATVQKQAGAGAGKPKENPNSELPSWLKERIQVTPTLIIVSHTSARVLPYCEADRIVQQHACIKCACSCVPVAYVHT